MYRVDDTEYRDMNRTLPIDDNHVVFSRVHTYYKVTKLVHT